MSKSFFIWGGVALVILALAGFGGWLFTLPAGTAVAKAPPVPRQEADAMLASLKPRRERPLVAVIGINDATETTDYLMPTGILRRADVADVMMLATGEGPVQLYPALEVEPDTTVAAFDAAHPQGADYVIVPAMSRDDDPAALAWIRSQAEKGATIVSVCAGAKVVAAAGLLDGKRATTHWNAAAEMARVFPKVRLEPDAIYVRDGDIWTSAGITAGMDLALALIEHDVGREAALAVARRHVLYMMRPGGQSQFSAELQTQSAGARTAAARRYIAAHLDGDLRSPVLAAAAGLSERSLLRAFREELGTTPADYVERMRVDAARRGLGAPHAVAKRVAAQCGFSSAETMRRAFRRTLGVSPADYRARFATTQRTLP